MSRAAQKTAARAPLAAPVAALLAALPWFSLAACDGTRGSYVYQGAGGAQGGESGERTDAGGNHDDARTQPADTGPGRFVERVVLSGLNKPVAVRFARDGRVFVAEKGGTIQQFAALGESRARLVVDLADEVHSYGDRGLIDIELDPEFPQKPYLYALYTLDGRIGDSLDAGSVPRYRDACPDPKGAGCIVAARLVRLTVGDDAAATRESQIILLENWAQQFSSHSIGSLTFGPDGFLYVAAGDGASFEHVDYGNLGGNPLRELPEPASTDQRPPWAMGGALRAQVLAPVIGATKDAAQTTQPSFAGKVIRLDARQALPAGAPGATAPQILAAGLRNPYRITLRPHTPELWLADVGWNTWEEINRIADVTDARHYVAENTPNNQPTNFGWPCYEGPVAQPGYEAAGLSMCSDLYARPTSHTPPAYAYHHWAEVAAGDGCGVGGSAVSGLAFYDEGGYPSRYRGSLFFTDYTRRCIWVAPVSADGTLDAARIELFAKGIGKPAQLTIGPGGDLYYVDLDGTIRRFEYSTSNHAPSATFEASARWGSLPLKVTLDASGSRDPDTDEDLRYAWDLDGDGAFDDGDGVRLVHTFTTRGATRVGVQVTDARGASTKQYLQMWPGLSPPAPVIATAAPAAWRVGEAIAFSGFANDGENKPLPAAALTWSIIVLHCPSACHEHPMQELTGVHAGLFEAPDHEFPMRLLIRLHAVDGNGLMASVDRELPPATSEVTIDSEPRGLRLAFNGTAATTPFSRTVILGSRNSISAPSQVVEATDGESRTTQLVAQTFAGWSDGEAQDHLVTANQTAVRYVASFAAHPLSHFEREATAILTHETDEPSGDDDPRECIRDGVFPALDSYDGNAQLIPSYPPLPGEDAYVGYRFATPLTFARLVFQEGMHYESGGFFDSLRVEVRDAGAWKTVPGLRARPAYTGANGVPWETFVLDFEPTFGDAIRLIGRPGGPDRFVSVAELEVWGESAPAHNP
jgi:glucose/arabinose dehydrogenase